MFSPETTTTLLIEFYLLGIAGHLILLMSLMAATKPDDASKRTGQTLTVMAIVASVLWPGLAVLLLLMTTPFGPWVLRKLGHKFDGPNAGEATS